MGDFYEVCMFWQADQAMGDKAGLGFAEHIARAAEFEIGFCNLEPVFGAAQGVQALTGGFGERGAVEEEAEAGGAAPPDAAAELVELGEAKTFGALDHHDGGFGNIDPDLDYGCGDEELGVAGSESFQG